jgi:hypothetical protein
MDVDMVLIERSRALENQMEEIRLQSLLQFKEKITQLVRYERNFEEFKLVI